MLNWIEPSGLIDIRELTLCYGYIEIISQS